MPRALDLSNECPHNSGAGAIVLLRLLRDYLLDRMLVVTNNVPPPAAGYHVFEPNPANLTRLRSNLALNAIAATVHATAVATKRARPDFLATALADIWLMRATIKPSRSKWWI
jgi:hypothetical protein